MPVRGGRKSLHTPGYDLVMSLLRETRLAAGLSQTELAARLRRASELRFQVRAGASAGLTCWNGWNF